MAWIDTALIIVRNLINDIDPTNYTYTDARLTSIIYTSSFLVTTDITSLGNTYSVDLTGVNGIAPDPTPDSAFTSFACLRAACLVDQSLLRTKAMVAGISAKCGPAVLDTMRHMDGFKELITVGACETYKVMKWDFMFGSGAICQVIMSPFISNTFNPENLGLKFSDARNSYFM